MRGLEKENTKMDIYGPRYSMKESAKGQFFENVEEVLSEPNTRIHMQKLPQGCQKQCGGGTMGDDTMQIKWQKKMLLRIQLGWKLIPEITHIKFQLSSTKG